MTAIEWILVPARMSPEMLAAGWTAISKEKKALGIARLGPGPCFADFYVAAIGAAPPADTVEAIKSIMSTLSDEQRLEVSTSCCNSCGRADPKCQCWNDE